MSGTVYERYPLTFNDPHVTARVRAAFEEHFGADRVLELDPVPTSEDFSVIPDAFGTPYTYWGLGGFAADSTVVPNHSPDFAPDMQPTLRTGTEAIVVAALAFLDGPAPVTEPPPRAAWDMRSWAGLRPVTQ